MSIRKALFEAFFVVLARRAGRICAPGGRVGGRTARSARRGVGSGHESRTLACRSRWLVTGGLVVLTATRLAGDRTARAVRAEE